MWLIRQLHAWAGAVLSLILIVSGLTGAFLALKPDYLRLTIPEARAVVQPTPEKLGAAAEAVERAHGHHLQRLVFAGSGLGLHQAYLMDDSYAYADADGRIIAQWTGAARPETFVYELHHYLLAGERGMKLMGAAGLAAGVLALTGLVVWAPAWRTFRLRLWPRSTARRDLLGAHRNLGLVFALPLIFFCLTGAAIVFYQTSERLLLKAFPGPEVEEFFPPADPGDIDWPRALAAAQARFPKAQIRAAVWPAGVWAPAIVKMRQPGELPSEGETEVLIDPSTSRVLGVKDARAFPPGLRLFADLWPLHTAAIGGRLYDALGVLSGLALAGLGGLGLWSFLIKPRRRRAPARADARP